MKLLSKCEKHTVKAGRRFGRELKGGDVVLLKGELGAGKTTFVKGVAKALKIKDSVTSPTFALMREYGGGLRLCHIDAYRLSGGEEAVFAGLAEHIGAPDAVCVIEWYQNIASVLPQKGARRIEISRSLCADSDDAREIIFE